MAFCRLNNSLITVKSKTIKNLADTTGEAKGAINSQLIGNTSTYMVLVAISPAFNILPCIHNLPMRKEINFVTDRPRYYYFTSKISSRI